MTAIKPADIDYRTSTPDPSRPGALICAATREGWMMPVIDVTDPHFAVPDDSESLNDLFRASIKEEQRRRHVPKLIMRWMLRSAAKRSRLVQSIFNPGAAFLDGISTYVMKLGADNLPPPYDTPIDKRVAGSPHLTLLRLRTQQVTRLLARGVAADLAGVEATPLHLINIGGGPAIDSMNALIVLRKRDGDLLRRPMTIHVLDQDDAGPLFGRNALAALMKDGGPLAGLNIVFDHRRYDWDKPEPLETLVSDLRASSAIIAASTEGGLFEYGSDAAVVANLSVLRAGNVRYVAGSVTSADESRRRQISVSRFKVIPRGLAGFAPLAERAGYSIAKAEPARLSEQVLLESA